MHNVYDRMNLEDLNESQREAVLCIDAPSLVIAGAGSGKTNSFAHPAPRDKWKHRARSG